MRATADDDKPRSDGYYGHRAVWAEVHIGTILGTGKVSERWEVIDMAHGQQVEFAHTMWFKIREQKTGIEHFIEPKLKTATVTILTQDPRDRSTGEATWPGDSDMLLLLRDELGATLLATRDEETGEITCPDYAAGYNHLDEIGNGSLRRGLLEHLKTCHGMAEAEIASPNDIAALITLHGQAHNPLSGIGKGGLPHRHVPEDLSLI